MRWPWRRKATGPMVVGLRGWRPSARFAVIDNDLQTGVVTLRMLHPDTGALSPYVQEAHTVNVVWPGEDR